MALCKNLIACGVEILFLTNKATFCTNRHDDRIFHLLCFDQA
ncbi:Uncharacterised protein [Vibrio cholerae]|nr:Uncharacterised protein [Vibrio cholerae]